MTNPQNNQPTPDPATQPDQPRELDSVDRRVLSIFYDAFNRANPCARMPGSVYIDENGEVA